MTATTVFDGVCFAKDAPNKMQQYIQCPAFLARDASEVAFKKFPIALNIAGSVDGSLLLLRV